MTVAPRFAGKSMVVTGAAQGIGKQVALEAAKEGGRLTLVDRSPLVQEVARQINAEHGQGQSIAVEADSKPGPAMNKPCIAPAPPSVPSKCS